MPKSLSLDKGVSEHLRPVKDSDGTLTSLEVSTDKVRVADLEITGDTESLQGLKRIGNTTSAGGTLKIFNSTVEISAASNTLTLTGNAITKETGNLTVQATNANLQLASAIDGLTIIYTSADYGFIFDTDNKEFKIPDGPLIQKWFSIKMTSTGTGATTISTYNILHLASLTLEPDGFLVLQPSRSIQIKAPANYTTQILATTKTASGTTDTTLDMSETLDLGSGAGGSDVHYGIRYLQTQTDLTGWDTVYLMYLSGGSGKILHIDNNANLTLSDNRKVVFGDAGEYIKGDGTDLDIVSSNDITLWAPDQIILNVASAAGGIDRGVIINDPSAVGQSLMIKNTHDSSSGGKLVFLHDRDGEVGEDGDTVGSIFFKGYNDDDHLTANQIKYASIVSSIVDASDTDEAGRMRFYVYSSGYEFMAFKIEGSTAGTLALTLGSTSADLITIIGDLDIDGDLMTTAGTFKLQTGSTGNYTIDCGGDIILDSHDGIVKFYDAGDTGEYFKIVVGGGSGLTTLQTYSDDATGHLVLKADGHVEFDGCGVGFDKALNTFAAAGVTSEGDDSTDIDFRTGNKHGLVLDDNIAGSGEHINLIFPATSGNFILTLTQDATGSRTVHSDGWKAYASDASLCDNTLGANLTDGEVRWAGGSAPTLTTTVRKTDIVSIYWDADEQTAMATASLNF